MAHQGPKVKPKTVENGKIICGAGRPSLDGCFSAAFGRPGPLAARRGRGIVMGRIMVRPVSGIGKRGVAGFQGRWTAISGRRCVYHGPFASVKAVAVLVLRSARCRMCGGRECFEVCFGRKVYGKFRMKWTFAIFNLLYFNFQCDRTYN